MSDVYLSSIHSRIFPQPKIQNPNSKNEATRIYRTYSTNPSFPYPKTIPLHLTPYTLTQLNTHTQWAQPNEPKTKPYQETKPASTATNQTHNGPAYPSAHSSASIAAAHTVASVSISTLSNPSSWTPGRTIRSVDSGTAGETRRSYDT